MNMRVTRSIEVPDLPKRLAARREELGLPRIQVCEKAGISVGHLGDLEHGRKSGIPWETLERIAIALNTTIDELVK